jgi:hypothetical protein
VRLAASVDGETVRETKGGDAETATTAATAVEKIQVLETEKAEGSVSGDDE